MGYLLGLDIGGTKCAAVLGREEEGGITLLGREVLATDLKVPAPAFLESLLSRADALLEKNGLSARRLEGIGVSCGGPLDSETGVILSPPNLPGWDAVPIIDMLKTRFRVPARLQNDANACALAEWKYGAAKGLRNVVFLTFGTGMGAGLILDGRLYEGTSGMAGEVGHVRLAGHGPVGYGKEGSFEGFCSGGGIAQLARTMALEKLQQGEKVSFCGSVDELAGITAKAVGDAAEAGDELARQVFAVCGRYLGMGLSVLIDILNPEMIVIGSVYARRETLLKEAALKQIDSEALPRSSAACRVAPAGLGESIGDYAALAVGAHRQE